MASLLNSRSFFKAQYRNDELVKNQMIGLIQQQITLRRQKASALVKHPFFFCYELVTSPFKLLGFLVSVNWKNDWLSKVNYQLALCVPKLRNFQVGTLNVRSPKAERMD